MVSPPVVCSKAVERFEPMVELGVLAVVVAELRFIIANGRTFPELLKRVVVREPEPGR